MKINEQKFQGLLQFVAEQLADKPTTLKILGQLAEQCVEPEEEKPKKK